MSTISPLVPNSLEHTGLSAHPQLMECSLWDKLPRQHQVKLDPRENCTWKKFEGFMSTSPGSSRGIYCSNIQQSYISKVIAEAAVKRSWTLILGRCMAWDDTLKEKATFYQIHSKGCVYSVGGQRRGTIIYSTLGLPYLACVYWQTCCTCYLLPIYFTISLAMFMLQKGLWSLMILLWFSCPVLYRRLNHKLETW